MYINICTPYRVVLNAFQAVHARFVEVLWRFSAGFWGLGRFNGPFAGSGGFRSELWGRRSMALVHVPFLWSR